MTTIAQVRVPVDEFALSETLPQTPDVSVEVNRLVAYSTPHVMPFLWAIGDSLDEFEDALRSDQTVESVECLTRLDDERYYRMNWTESVDLLTHILTRNDGAILNARGHEGFWHLRVHFKQREVLAQTQEYCERHDLTLDVERVYRLTENNQRTEGLFGLTEQQYESLITAFERGYYDIPRRATARDLAADLSISHSAVSERLRRGHRNLIANSLVTAQYRDTDGR